MRHYDYIIIGSGIAGLYTALKLKKKHSSFLILEKNSRHFLGGRTRTDSFFGCHISPGAGILKKNKDSLVIDLLNSLQVPYHEAKSKYQYSFPEINIHHILEEK